METCGHDTIWGAALNVTVSEESFYYVKTLMKDGLTPSQIVDQALDALFTANKRRASRLKTPPPRKPDKQVPKISLFKFKKSLKTQDLPVLHKKILIALFDAEDGLILADLVRAVETPNSTVREALKKLIPSGLIERREDTKVYFLSKTSFGG
jgi:hypothetical protein